MGISPELAAEVVRIIKADAAAHGGTVRTKRVLEALKELQLTATGPAIKILATYLGFKIELAQEVGKAIGGRPPGARDRRPRKPRDDRPSRREDVQRLRVEHPKWTLEQIADELDMTKQAVSYHLKEKKRSPPSDG